jgi:hypothetical protein
MKNRNSQEFKRYPPKDELHNGRSAWLSGAMKHGAVNTSNRPGMMEELVNALLWPVMVPVNVPGKPGLPAVRTAFWWDLWLIG